MEQGTLFVLVVLFIAYSFDFINGFHDAANSIATIVTTGVLTPKQAVLWAAFFNFIAFMFFNLMVAHTVGQDLLDMHIVDAKLILSALLGAILWNLITWFYGLPSSSSHALIGGLAGAAIAKGGLITLKFNGFLKVAIGIIFSPFLGLIIGLLLAAIFTYFLNRKKQKDFQSLFKFLQLGSSAFLSLTHGGNDAQKTMGIISILLFSSAWLKGPFYVPLWVVLSCQLVISLGTLFGGWRIVRTLGTKITPLNPMTGCIAESSAAVIIFLATLMGIPVSTTQTLTGAIAGIGINRSMRKTHWPMLKVIFLSWILTLPSAGVVAALIMWIMN